MDWSKLVDIGFDVAKVAAAGTPVGVAVTVLDTIVDKSNTDEGIKDNDVIQVLETLAKSSHNKVDDKLVCMVKAYLQCEKGRL